MLCALLGGLAVALLTAPLLAGDDPKPAPVDEKATLEAYVKAGTPGPAHKRLEIFIGSWTYTNGTSLGGAANRDCAHRG